MTITSMHHITRNAIAIGLICVFVLQISHCTSPTESIAPEFIIETLRSIPEVPVPLETDENVDHPGFIRTKQFCEHVISVRYLLFSLTSNLTDPVRNGHNWEWQKFHSDGESHVTFAASWGDTISYQATFHGPAYSYILNSYAYSDTLSGWMHRQTGDGMFDLGPDYGLSWFTNHGLVGFGATTWYGISIDELENAYTNEGSDAGLYQDDGSGNIGVKTPHFLDSSLSIGGVKIQSLTYPQGDPSEYATKRTFAITLFADFQDCT